MAKTAAKTAGAKPAKVEQPHGGALLAGGVPGNAVVGMVGWMVKTRGKWFK